MWMGEHRGSKVAVKVLRLTSSNLDKVTSVGYSLNSPGVYSSADYNCIDVLQGSNDVEKSSPSKRTPVSGCANDKQPPCNGIGMDVQREYK